MTHESTDKPETTKSAELKARIRYAAALKFVANLTDAELAQQLEVSVHTIADWKRRPEWREAITEIANKQVNETFSEMLAMAVHARQVFQDLMREDSPPALRFQAAQAVLRLALHPTTGSRP